MQSQEYERNEEYQLAPIFDGFHFSERFSAPNPTDSAHFHNFYHVPSACQPVTHQRGRIWVARIVRSAFLFDSEPSKGEIFQLVKGLVEPLK